MVCVTLPYHVPSDADEALLWGELAGYPEALHKRWILADGPEVGGLPSWAPSVTCGLVCCELRIAYSCLRATTL